MKFTNRLEWVKYEKWWWAIEYQLESVAIVTHKSVLSKHNFSTEIQTRARTLKLICICGLQSVSAPNCHSISFLLHTHTHTQSEFHFTQWDIFCEIRSISFFVFFFYFKRENVFFLQKNENQILPALCQFNLLCDLKG